MMRFGRISAVLAMLVFQPLAAVKAGDVSFIRVDTNNSSASSWGSVYADGDMDGDSDSDAQLWSTASGVNIALLGWCESSATYANTGYVELTCPAHCYVCEGECETIDAWCLIVEGDNAGPATAYLAGGVDVSASHTMQLEDDGDSMTENATLLGTINIHLTLSLVQPPEELCWAFIDGPGVHGYVEIRNGYYGRSGGGEIVYTDTNGQEQTIDAADYYDGDSIHITLNVSAVMAEGSQFTVSYSGHSGAEPMQLYGPNGNTGGTSSSMVGWAYSATAP